MYTNLCQKSSLLVCATCNALLSPGASKVTKPVVTKFETTSCSSPQSWRASLRDSHRSRFGKYPHCWRCHAYGIWHVPFVVLLKTGHDTEIGLAFRTVVFCFSAQNAPMCVHGVPAIIAAQSRTRTNNRTMTRACVRLWTNQIKQSIHTLYRSNKQMKSINKFVCYV